MNVLLSHVSLEPLLYGLVIFLGLASLWWKLITHRWLGLFAELTVFVIVFRLHGGSMTGGFAATVAALLAGLVFPLMLRRRA